MVTALLVEETFWWVVTKANKEMHSMPGPDPNRVTEEYVLATLAYHDHLYQTNNWHVKSTGIS